MSSLEVKTPTRLMRHNAVNMQHILMIILLFFVTIMFQWFRPFNTAVDSKFDAPAFYSNEFDV